MKLAYFSENETLFCYQKMYFQIEKTVLYLLYVTEKFMLLMKWDMLDTVTYISDWDRVRICIWIY
jgi:hypothetical protein